MAKSSDTSTASPSEEKVNYLEYLNDKHPSLDVYMHAHFKATLSLFDRKTPAEWEQIFAPHFGPKE